MVAILGTSHDFPHPDHVSEDAEPGLVAIGGDLHPHRVMCAYQSGIFPWSVSPITWWSPDPRAVFEFPGFHLSRSFKRRLRQATYQVTFDRAFPQVIRACADRKENESTWISEAFIEAYETLHEQGHAHSVEAWYQDELVGGVYGIASGGLFAGESMFHHRTDASKVALYTLYQSINAAGFTLFDIQMLTPVTEQLGAIEIPRKEYLRRLKQAIKLPCQFPESPTT